MEHEQWRNMSHAQEMLEIIMGCILWYREEDEVSEVEERTLVCISMNW